MAESLKCCWSKDEKAPVCLWSLKGNGVCSGGLWAGNVHSAQVVRWQSSRVNRPVFIKRILTAFLPIKPFITTNMVRAGRSSDCVEGMVEQNEGCHCISLMSPSPMLSRRQGAARKCLFAHFSLMPACSWAPPGAHAAPSTLGARFWWASFLHQHN